MFVCGLKISIPRLCFYIFCYNNARTETADFDLWFKQQIKISYENLSDFWNFLSLIQSKSADSIEKVQFFRPIFVIIL